MEVSYASSFLKTLKGLPDALQEEALDKIELFRDPNNHNALKVHKLQGRLRDRYGFSVNYKIRIVFIYVGKKPKEAVLLAIGDHSVYQ